MPQPPNTTDHEALAKEIGETLDMLGSQLGSETVEELIEVYLQNSQSQIGQFRDAESTGDHARIVAIAHSLKSSSANMGAATLAEACLQLEKSKPGDSRVASLLAEVRSLHADTIATMSAYRPKP